MNVHPYSTSPFEKVHSCATKSNRQGREGVPEEDKGQETDETVEELAEGSPTEETMVGIAREEPERDPDRGTSDGGGAV